VPIFEKEGLSWGITNETCFWIVDYASSIFGKEGLSWGTTNETSLWTYDCPTPIYGGYVGVIYMVGVNQPP